MVGARDDGALDGLAADLAAAEVGLDVDGDAEGAARTELGGVGQRPAEDVVDPVRGPGGTRLVRTAQAGVGLLAPGAPLTAQRLTYMPLEVL